MEVRQATRGDLLEIARIAHRSRWSACDGLLRSSTICAALDEEYGPSSLKRRLLEGAFLVAVSPEGRLVGLAESDIAGSHVAVRIHAASLTPQNSSWVRDLVRAVGNRYPGRPLCADVLLGSESDEQFCEAAGFVPGEVIQRTMFGEEVVERRWWGPLPE